MSLQLIASFYNPFRTGDETYSPACHGISLGYTVHNHCTFLHFRELCNALVCTDIIDMFVNLVSKHYHLRMFCQYSSQSCQFFLTIYRPCRIRRRAKNQCLCLRSNSSFQLFRCNFEILFDAGRNNHGSTFRQFHHFRITHPIRSRHNYFVTRINQYEDCVTN